MSIQEHLPISSEPDLMPRDKRDWWNQVWEGKLPKQPRMAVFQYSMNASFRPTAPNETIAYGYVQNNKLHDKEPEIIVQVIEALDPNFFDNYPRRPNTKYDLAFKKSIISDAARAFYRHGLAAYGKPKLRKSDPNTSSVLPAPLAVI